MEDQYGNNHWNVDDDRGGRGRAPLPDSFISHQYPFYQTEKEIVGEAAGTMIVSWQNYFRHFRSEVTIARAAGSLISFNRNLAAFTPTTFSTLLITFSAATSHNFFGGYLTSV